MHDTWAARDLPVLNATVALLEQSYMVTVTDVAARTGFAVEVVAQALTALDPVYVDFRKTTTGGDPRFWYVFKATPEARRAVGQWPSAESLATGLAEELAAAARRESNSERQGLLTYAARLVGDTLRDATVRAARQVLGPAFGGAPQPEMGMPVPEPPAVLEPDFPSLVPLPELPELLRLRSDGQGSAGSPPHAGYVAGSRAASSAPDRDARPQPTPEVAADLQDRNPLAQPTPDVAADLQDRNPLPQPTPDVAADLQDRNPLPQPAADAPNPTPHPEPSPEAAPDVPEQNRSRPEPTPVAAAGTPDLNPRPESASEGAAEVPDLNPWPEPAEVSEADVAEVEAAAPELEPLPEPSPFPHSITSSWSAVDSWPTAAAKGEADPDSEDTDLDVVGSHGDTSSSA